MGVCCAASVPCGYYAEHLYFCGKFRVVAKPVAQSVSWGPLTSNTLASPTASVLPVETTAPLAMKRSPCAGASILVVKSTVENR